MGLFRRAKETPPTADQAAQTLAAAEREREKTLQRLDAMRDEIQRSVIGTPSAGQQQMLAKVDAEYQQMRARLDEAVERLRANLGAGPR